MHSPQQFSVQCDETTRKMKMSESNFYCEVVNLSYLDTEWFYKKVSRDFFSQNCISIKQVLLTFSFKTS